MAKGSWGVVTWVLLEGSRRTGAASGSQRAHIVGALARGALNHPRATVKLIALSFRIGENTSILVAQAGGQAAGGPGSGATGPGPAGPASDGPPAGYGYGAPPQA